MKYINMTYATKTFYGITFKPGEEHEVPGFINADGMFRTDISEYPKEVKKSEPKVAEQVVAESTEAPADEETEKPKRGRKSKECES